jgi:plastocyanin
MRNWEMQQRKIGRILGTATLGAVAVLSLVFISGAVRPRPVAAAQQQPAANAVSIDNFMFTPMELTVPVGATVTWTNKDDVPHTVVSVDHLFKSKALDTDDTFSFTFQNAGTYEYFCSVHPRMTAKIIVK